MTLSYASVNSLIYQCAHEDVDCKRAKYMMELVILRSIWQERSMGVAVLKELLSIFMANINKSWMRCAAPRREGSMVCVGRVVQ